MPVGASASVFSDRVCPEVECFSLVGSVYKSHGWQLTHLTASESESVKKKCKKYNNFSNLVSKCSAKFALFSARLYHVTFSTYYSPEGEMCYNSTDHA